MRVLLVIAGIVLIGVIWIFNRLVALKVRAANAWSDIDVQLKRRADLIPPLVETVRGYASHERKTLEATIAARGAATQAGSIEARGRAETDVGRHIASIIALREAYPDLKADEVFQSLHTNLVEVEDHLQSARRYYNAVVRDFNTMQRQFPHVLVAGMTGMKPREFFQLDDASEAATPQVRLSESGR
jgi:LemA protein